MLAERGVIGSFGIDFLVVPATRSGGRSGPGGGVYLSEINLRMGGTTHPYWMARLATGATFDTDSGELVTADGRPVRYVATDNLKSDAYVGLLPESLIAALRDEGLAFDPVTKTGVLLHLLGSLKKHGKTGMTCVADSPAEADALYEMAIGVLERLGAAR